MTRYAKNEQGMMGVWNSRNCTVVVPALVHVPVLFVRAPCSCDTVQGSSYNSKTRGNRDKNEESVESGIQERMDPESRRKKKKLT